MVPQEFHTALHAGPMPEVVPKRLCREGNAPSKTFGLLELLPLRGSRSSHLSVLTLTAFAARNSKSFSSSLWSHLLPPRSKTFGLLKPLPYRQSFPKT